MGEVILNSKEIQKICTDIAKKLENKFKKSDSVPIFIGVLKGAAPFFMDLIKRYNLPMKIDFVQVSSYSGTSSTGVIHLVKDLTEQIKNKDIVIVEDIVDTGLTLSYLKQYFQIKYQPRSITIVSLIDKKPLRKIELEVDYSGLVLVQNKFLVGYGLDYKELVRNTNEIFVPTKAQLDKWDEELLKDLQ